MWWERSKSHISELKKIPHASNTGMSYFEEIVIWPSEMQPQPSNEESQNGLLTAAESSQTSGVPINADPQHAWAHTVKFQASVYITRYTWNWDETV